MPGRVHFLDEAEDHPGDVDRLPLKRRKLSPSEQRSRSSSDVHPLHVLPSGNRLLDPTAHAHDIRPGGLGALSVLSDTLLLAILALSDPPSLLALSATSRALLAYARHEPLWKDLFISRAGGVLGRWDGTWRTTFLQSFGARHPLPLPSDSEATPLSANGLFSDVLFQPYLCARTPLAPYFYPHPTRPRSSIPRHPASQLSPETFRELYALPSKPVILTGMIDHWPAYRSPSPSPPPSASPSTTTATNTPWSLPSLASRFPTTPFRAEAFDTPLHTYAHAYAEHCAADDAPLYIFDSRFVEKTAGALGDDVDGGRLPLFGRDLFELLGGEERPDYRWLIAGPERTGSTFHKDPNGTSAWNAVITGRKGWVMFPPTVCPPGVYTNDDESEVTSPLSIAEWFMGFFELAWETYGPHASDPATRGKMHVGICHAGEVVYVPSGWWHLVVNLDASVAVTQNFVSDVELAAVLRFMRDKPDQISGFKGGLDPETIYARFCDALREHAPEAFAAATTHRNSVQKESLWDQVIKKPSSTKVEGGFSFGFAMDDEEEDGI